MKLPYTFVRPNRLAWASKPLRFVLFASALLSYALATSAISAASELTIHYPYARAMAPGATTSAVFATFDNPSDVPINIINATTPTAQHVELHTVIKNGEMMQMRQVTQITVPANGSVTLKPGSFHLMLFELPQPLKEGEIIEVNLEFSNGDKQLFKAPVKKVMAGMKSHHH